MMDMPRNPQIRSDIAHNMHLGKDNNYKLHPPTYINIHIDREA